LTCRATTTTRAFKLKPGTLVRCAQDGARIPVTRRRGAATMEDDDEAWIGASACGKTCWAARVEPGGARVRVYAASLDDFDDDDDDDDDAETTTKATSFVTLSLGVNDARRGVRIARGIEVARDGTEMLTRVRETFERGSVEAGEALTRADGSGLTATFDANDARNGGRTTSEVDFEWCGKVVGKRLTRERVLERIIVGLGATARRKRRRAEEREESEKQTKRPKSASATPASSPAKGTSVGKWMSERRTRPRLRALAEEDKRTAD